jgi:hypothetical protein
MVKWTRWTPEGDEELKRHKTAGLTSREIAVLLGCTPTAIQTRARKLRLFSPPRRNGFWTPERDEELKRHEAAGLSASAIAGLLHTTRNAVLGRPVPLAGLGTIAPRKEVRFQPMKKKEAAKRVAQGAAL